MKHLERFGFFATTCTVLFFVKVAIFSSLKTDLILEAIAQEDSSPTAKSGEKKDKESAPKQETRKSVKSEIKEDKSTEEDAKKKDGPSAKLMSREEMRDWIEKKSQEVTVAGYTKGDLSFKVLRERYDELEQWEKDLNNKERVIMALRDSAKQEVAVLKQATEDFKKAVTDYQTLRENKVNSIVKIYETMKPVDAANIISTLDNDVLLEFIGAVKSAKLAPILAKMSPMRAEEITKLIADSASVTARRMKNECCVCKKLMS